MAAVFALVLLALTAIAFSIIMDTDAGETLPFAVFSIILYLYFFYCADLFHLGTMLLFPVLGAFLVYAFARGIKGGMKICQKLTPAFAVFCFTSAFFLLYTADNHCVNWDELRVWGAMPKAIYETKQLQLGAGALIFDSGDNMQTYPPALPLFANFFLSASKDFAESYLFLAYAVFVSAITVSPFRGFSWKQWWLIPIAFLFVICAPFVLTLHGGDNSYFYESLFIDPVLGFAAGYVFYLAASKPFESRFARIRFALALGVLVIIKDTGILFAALSLLCAVYIRRAEDKTSFTVLLRELIIPAGLMCLCYFVWKGLLQYRDISNHISLQIGIPSAQVIGALAQLLLRAPIINLVVFGISFGVYCLILLGAGILAEAVFKTHSRANNLCTAALCTVSFLLFAFGYINIFPYDSPELLLDLSYYRYFTTLTAAWLILWFLRYLPVVVPAIGASGKKIAAAVFVVGLLACGFGCFVLSYWETDYTGAAPFVELAAEEQEAILQQIPADTSREHQRVYLLMAEKEPNIFHHRFYFDLIGTGVNVENFYPDTDMHNGLTPSPYSVEETAEKWYDRLQTEGYDYIYVYSANDVFDQAFAHLGLEKALPGHAYPVK